MAEDYKEPRLDLAIPQELEYNRGINSTKGPNAASIYIRTYKAEREKFKEAAARIQVSYNAMIKHLMNEACDKILAMSDEEIETLIQYRIAKASSG